ncbi:sigma-70 family RNA polymerase sigma factor [Nocardia brasiliensis]|uniref:sigma-70 family RNA polymerase sigma factor n=1 Tax=Nocardia brasiliensis TaxID=37326 RepID=UPI00366D2E33
MGPVTRKIAPSTTPMEAASAEFDTHRDLLYALVYNVLGSVADTEDVLQETWLAWAAAPGRAEVANPRAYLVRIAINDALARLARLRRDRSIYPGPWLPDPMLTEADASEQALRSESVSLAMMVVLETLTPLERAVFVLKDAFGYSHPEIADLIGRTPVSVRQVAHRARQHVRQQRGRYQVDRETWRAVTERFLTAAIGGDLNALLEVLAPDVAMWTDGGGLPGTARRVITGRDKVIRLLNAVTGLADGLDAAFVEVNGGPAAVLYRGAAPYAVVVLDIRPEDGFVRAIYNIVSPDKLRGVAATRPGRPQAAPVCVPEYPVPAGD